MGTSVTTTPISILDTHDGPLKGALSPRIKSIGPTSLGSPAQTGCPTGALSVSQMPTSGAQPRAP
ncbi:MAG: hypothetical protein Kow0056_13660 [Coriobacteriia bacterium]